jgi:ring-1,2-phenylacetyl-CoA epoxidase subunit PaaD
MVITEALIWQALNDIVDPEIPVVSLVEMGIIRAVIIQDEQVIVTMTPTFSGCPALKVMEEDICSRLGKIGVENVEVVSTFKPPWTSDWIKPEAREKIKQIGLAPPKMHAGDFGALLIEPVTCPYCDSENTTLKNSFGSTPCRMIYYCNNCQQPFEQFKPI